MDYIRPQLLILIPVLIGIGQFFKRQGLNAKRVPFVLLAIGFFVAAVYGFVTSTYVGWRMILDAFVITGFCQGCVVAFAAMGFYDTAKSTKKE